MATAKTPRAPSSPPNAPSSGAQSLLRQLGIIGIDHLEPVILAAIATEQPLLLIGTHGTAKSLLLSRLCEALDLTWRHYNASLINYDDLVGYPLPDDAGNLKFVQTPASIWGAEAVFIDEISRCRPDMLNRLFPIIHERRIQGLPLTDLRFRWAAMNPPSDPDADEGNYVGSEPLDPALADRFPFIVTIPAFATLSAIDQKLVIQSSPSTTVPPDVSTRLRESIEAIRQPGRMVQAVLADVSWLGSGSSFRPPIVWNIGRRPEFLPLADPRRNDRVDVCRSLERSSLPFRDEQIGKEAKIPCRTGRWECKEGVDLPGGRELRSVPNKGCIDLLLDGHLRVQVSDLFADGCGHLRGLAGCEVECEGMACAWRERPKRVGNAGRPRCDVGPEIQGQE
ncbi:MAG: hypothetical protein EBZ89_08090 [Chloroflexi bacterium]|nr:hypothetical protein [Chloroflexota bacterium]